MNRSLETLGLAPRRRGFTLLELLVVIGLVAMLSFFLVSGLSGGGRTAALQSAQSALANLVTAARTRAMATGQSVRVLVQVDAASSVRPPRFLRHLTVQLQTPSGWQLVHEAYLPEGIYVIPGNFSSLPAGLFAADTSSPWSKSDGSALRSTALRSSQISVEQISGVGPEQWVSVVFASAGTTMQSGDIILASGRVRPPGTYATGDSPVVLDNPDEVRGLTLSAYGVPTLVNDRTGF